MIFRKISILATSFLIGSTLVLSTASAGPIEDRKAKMKEVGKQVGIIGKMMKGETEFNGEAALAAYQAIGQAGTGFMDLFPEGTETGGETTASPKIWSDRAGFNAAGNAFVEDLMAAIQAGVPANKAALGATFGPLTENCGACHKDYRVKKN